MKKQVQTSETGKTEAAAQKPRGRSFKGVHPVNGQEVSGRVLYDGGYAVAGAIEVYGVEWVVYERMNKSADWVDVRVIARHKARDKASYWLSWSVTENRLANGKDAWTMAQHRPALVTAVSDLMAAYFDAYDILYG